MSDEQIRQRIAYLVEHGGIVDDPLDDIRRSIRRLFALTGVGVGGVMVSLALHLT